MEEIKKSKKGITRKEFLLTTAVVLLSGKQVFDTSKQLYDDYIKNQIYNSHWYVNNLQWEGVVDTDDKEIKTKGYGKCFAINEDYIISCHHVRETGIKHYRSPFGMITVHRPVKSNQFSVKGKKLEELFTNETYDVAIFNNPDIKPIPHHGYNTKPKLGQVVYVIGDPGLVGANIRKARVGDLDGFGNSPFSVGCFGLDEPVMRGDSGSPVVDDNFKLMGVARAVFSEGVGYVTKIDKYLNIIDTLDVAMKNEK